MSNISRVVDIGGGRIVDLEPYLASAKVGPADHVLISGTLVEGIGNEFSDIDIYVFSDRQRSGYDVDHRIASRVLSSSRSIIDATSNDDVFLMHFPTHYNGIKVDIEFQTFRSFDSLCEEIEEIHGYAVRNYILLTKCMSERSMSLVHRIQSGRLFAGGSNEKQLRSRIDLDKYLYLLYRWNASDYADLLDIVGAWKKREYLRCADLARENLIKQMLSYICLLGTTDYKRKWILARLDRSSASAELKREFTTLFAGPQNSDFGGYVQRALDCVDMIFGATADHFRNHQPAAYPMRDEVLAWLQSRIASAPSAYERIEAEYRMKAYVGSIQPTTALLDAEFK